jgi:hypothetical protein
MAATLRDNPPEPLRIAQPALGRMRKVQAPNTLERPLSRTTVLPSLRTKLKYVIVLDLTG